MSNDLKKLVKLVLDSYDAQPGIIKLSPHSSINRKTVIELIGKLRELVFPGYFGSKRVEADRLEYYAGELLEDIRYNLEKQVARALAHGGKDADLAEAAAGQVSHKPDAAGLTYEFLAKIPSVREKLEADVKATFDGDPAATGFDEIIFSYPGLYAIMVYRLAHELSQLGVPLIPRIMSEYAHEKTGIDIHPGAVIGHHFFIDHGTGIVVGETSEIGNHVKIYQGVTIGALSTKPGQALSGVKRHPTIEDNVVIYAGASILGGTTVIGKGTVIGSNAFITESVPENSKVL